jgi:hypothetical protein
MALAVDISCEDAGGTAPAKAKQNSAAATR